MAWMMSNPQIHNTFASLGVKHGDSYTISEDCINILNEILRNLIVEDRVLRTYRRAIGFGQNVKNDLMPLLIHAQTSKMKDATKIVDATVKILVNLTIPVECLLSVESVSKSDVGRHTIFELNRLLLTSKEVFADSRSTKAVVDHIKDTVEEKKLDIGKCDSINNCLLLLRNVLHIPENRIPNCVTSFQMQNQIIWNLFTQSVDKIILHLLSCSEKTYWSTTLVQLLALLYKDQHAGNLQKLISLWFEASLSDSSEDNESNTSPPDQGSVISSPIILSDPTSDSSDNGGANNNKNIIKDSNSNNNIKNNSEWSISSNNNKGEWSCSDTVKTNSDINRNVSSAGSVSPEPGMLCSNYRKLNNLKQQLDRETSRNVNENSGKTQNSDDDSKKMDCVSGELSDYGYGTQPENPVESISTSSNDDDQPGQKPVHQKPPNFHKTRYNSTKSRTVTVLEKKELRRKKLVKRGKMNIINMKGLLRHIPSNEDITNVLKEFTVDFLLKGYGVLVCDLYTQLLSNYHLQIDTSHFFWLMTYFLKFATQLELDFGILIPVLSFDILAYLVFQGVWIYEELETAYRNRENDFRPSLRRLHLTVTAIREFLQAVGAFSKSSHLTDVDKESLESLQLKIVEMKELRKLFILLLYQYNKDIQSKQYLQDLIVTNHLYLLFYENVCTTKNYPSNIMNHLKDFSTSEIMYQYGLLLEDFQQNGEFVNNCIFTMMHHVAGDLENVSALFQPHILKTFSAIWEIDFEVCDDWSDLIEYMIYRFINTSKESQNPDFTRVEHITPTVIQDGIEDLSTLAVSSSPSLDNEWTEEEKTNLDTYFHEGCSGRDTVENILKRYEGKGATSKTQKQIVKELIKQNIITENEVNTVSKDKGNKTIQHESENKEESEEISNQKNDIQILKEYLAKNNKGKFILWVQEVLLEACFAKLLHSNPEEFENHRHVPEPIEYYYASLNLPIPVVPWTIEQTNILKHQPFVLLLHKLGFHLPAEKGKIFVRIPNFWTPDYILSIAQQLAPLNPEKLKFTMNQVLSKMDTKEVIPLLQNKYHLHTSNDILQIERPHSPSFANVNCTVREKLESPMLMDISVKEDPEVMDSIEHNSICETASVASDLTRMYVSDEEDKVVSIQQDN